MGFISQNMDNSIFIDVGSQIHDLNDLRNDSSLNSYGPIAFIAFILLIAGIYYYYDHVKKDL